MLLQDDAKYISLNPLSVDASTRDRHLPAKSSTAGGFFGESYDYSCRAFPAYHLTLSMCLSGQIYHISTSTAATLIITNQLQNEMLLETLDVPGSPWVKAFDLSK